jgi:hypothetical protein
VEALPSWIDVVIPYICKVGWELFASFGGVAPIPYRPATSELVRCSVSITQGVCSKNCTGRICTGTAKVYSQKGSVRADIAEGGLRKHSEAQSGGDCFINIVSVEASQPDL